MQSTSFLTQLEKTTYPGRGLMVGKTQDAKNAVIVYFIMGRSENSRNRIFVATKDGIKTQCFDPTKMKDPSLIIYNPVRVFNDTTKNTTIVTNGNQTDTIFDFMTQGKDIVQALKTRTFEPDVPNFTPRISLTLDIKQGKCCAVLSILKALDSAGQNCGRYFFDYEDIQPGKGYYLHTYSGDGVPLPCFCGEPEFVSIAPSVSTHSTQMNLQDFSTGVWQALNKDNKVSLFVRYIDLDTKKTNDIIINKNKCL